MFHPSCHGLGYQNQTAPDLHPTWPRKLPGRGHLTSLSSLCRYLVTLSKEFLPSLHPKSPHFKLKAPSCSSKVLPCPITTRSQKKLILFLLINSLQVLEDHSEVKLKQGFVKQAKWNRQSLGESDHQMSLIGLVLNINPQTLNLVMALFQRHISGIYPLLNTKDNSSTPAALPRSSKILQPIFLIIF